MLAARATSRLSQMIQLSNAIDLQIVDCSCRPGTVGTMACNYGRALRRSDDQWPGRWRRADR
jgi:hypothetical protein